VNMKTIITQYKKQSISSNNNSVENSLSMGLLLTNTNIKEQVDIEEHKKVQQMYEFDFSVPQLSKILSNTVPIINTDIIFFYSFSSFLSLNEESVIDILMSHLRNVIPVLQLCITK
jgi:hypothetical protein